ncbi:hypothetical protein AB0K09_00580 [Streptomyces sp. NPDC049577]|uniref:hypothetical protein n=1 Tax=Streptomyces sp. NPDC049577 TaxID=3155153 RepID=UPI00343DF6EF
MNRADGGARRARCPRCDRPVLRQLVGRRAALDVTADAAPMPAAAAQTLREPNRLTWCLRERSCSPDLRWLGPGHPADCPHPHVIDHQCTTPAAARPAAPRRTRKPPPVPAGQLTL